MKAEGEGDNTDEMVGWHHRPDGHEMSTLQELVMDKETWHAVVHGVARAGHD